MKVWFILFLVAWFGIPFLVITDLFPLHRYGMFARVALPASKPTLFSIETKTNPSPWKKLTIGNPYFDNSYLPTWAARTYHDTANAPFLVSGLRKSLGQKLDSVRIVAHSEGAQQTKVLLIDR